jgi:hypothetical protein
VYWTNGKVAINALYLQAMLLNGAQVGSARQKHNIFSCLCQSATEVTPDAACPDNRDTHKLLLEYENEAWNLPEFNCLSNYLSSLAGPSVFLDVYKKL